MIWLALWLRLVVQDSSPEPAFDPNLVDNVRALAPSIDVATAKLHVQAAARAARDQRFSPELLLAVAFVESRFDPSATSRIEGGRRVTGHRSSRSEAGRGPRFCGVMQTIAEDDWLSCLAMRDLDAGYLAGAIELRSWLRLAHGDLAHALDGHGCGIAGMRSGCHAYAERVLAIVARLSHRTS